MNGDKTTTMEKVNPTNKANPTTVLLWIVYIGLLFVLLPHTAWAFGRFEPVNHIIPVFGLFVWNTGDFTSWAAAFAFESAIAVLTHKLAKHWENSPRRFSVGPKFLPGWPKIKYRYLNAYLAGLLVAIGISSLANLSHSVEFGRDMKIFDVWGISPELYQVAFGAILPITSLLFAWVLSNEVHTDDQEDPAMVEAKKIIGELRRQLRESEARISETEVLVKEAEQRARDAETRFVAIGDLVARLFSENKRERILAVRSQWPQLPIQAVAMIAAASQSYVSEVLKESDYAR